MVYSLWSPSRRLSSPQHSKRSMSGSSTSGLTIMNAEASRSSSEGKNGGNQDKDQVKETDSGPPKMSDLAKLKDPASGFATVLDERGIPKGEEKEKEKERVVESKASSTKEEEDCAPNLFYAFARRTDSDKPSNSLYVLTFASASIISNFSTAIQNSFPDSHFSRDGPQLFTFKGADVLEKAWKAERKPDLQEMKSKWFFSLATTAQVLPLQNEKGWPISSNSPPPPAATSISPPAPISPTRPAVASRSSSLKGKEKKTVGFADQLPTPSAPLDMGKLERNLERVTKLVETNASQIASLSSYQETTYDTLAAALASSLEQLKTLTQSQQRLVAGQQRLVDACDELRKAMRERDDGWRAASIAFSSTASNASCGHEVHKPPRKVGRRVVGYVYDEEANGQREK